MSRIRTIGAAAVLAAAPLAFLPGGLFPFPLPKLTVLWLGVLLTACAPAAGRLPRGLMLLAAAACGWLGLVTVGHAGSPIDVIGRSPRYEGLLAVGAAVGACWAGARLFAGDDDAARAARTWFARTTAAGMVVTAAFAVAEATGARPLAGAADERVGSLLGNATDLGVYAAAVLLLLASRVAEAWQGRAAGDLALFGAAEAAAVTGIALSGSRGAVLALGAGTATVLVLTWWGQRVTSPARTGRVGAGARPAAVRGWAVAGLVVVLAGVAAAAALLVPASSDRLTGTDAVARASASGRVLIWERSLDLAADHPVTGVGANRYAAEILGRTDAGWARRIGFTHPLDSPHDVAVQLLVVGGIPLLLLALAWLVLAGRAAVARREPAEADPWPRIGAVATVVALGAGLLTHVSSASLVALGAVLTGALVAVPVPADGSAAGSTAQARVPGTVWRVAWGLAATIGLLVAGSGALAERPLREARDAALSGDAKAASRACDRAGRWRPWDPSVPSVCAQNAVLGGSAVPGDPAAEGADEVATALFTEGITRADRALARDTTDLGARQARAVALAELGRTDEARGELDRILTATPDDPAVLLRRSVVLAQLGELGAAVDDLRHVLAVEPDNQDARQNLTIVQGLLDAEG